MANKYIKGLVEKLTMLADDWLIFQPDAEEKVAYKIKQSNLPAVDDPTKLSKTDTADQSVESNVEFKKNVLADKLAANVAAQLNAIDASEAAIGSGYGGTLTAPTDGIIVEGNVGFGEPLPDEKLVVKNGTTRLKIIAEDDTGLGSFRILNDVGGTSHYSGMSVFGSNHPGGNLFGVARQDSAFLLSENMPLIIGTLDPNDLTLGALNTGIITLKASNKRVGIKQQNPEAQLDINQDNATAVIPAVKITQADVSEEMINFATTIGTGNAIEAKGAKTFTETHFIKINIEGVGVRYIPAGTIA